MKNPFRYFKKSPEIICVAVVMYGRIPLSLQQVEDLPHERGVDISHKKSSSLVQPIWCGVCVGD